MNEKENRTYPKILPKFQVVKIKAKNTCKTTKQFLEECKDSLNPNIVIIGEYVNSKTKIECLCKICNEYIFISPSEIKKGRGHAKCSYKLLGISQRNSHEDFVERVNRINPNVLILGQYITWNDRIKCRCKVCGFEWDGLPGNLLKGCGCSECAKWYRGKKRKDQKAKEYVEELKRRNLYLLEDYIDCYTSILHKCMFCGCEFKADPHHMLTRGVSCPSCYASNGENAISSFFIANNIRFESQKKYNDLIGVGGGLLSYDFYIPDYNKLIEYNGEQHEHPVDYFGGEEKFKIQQEHDQRKREYAKAHNIDLLEIWYYDYNNLEEILTKCLNLKSVTTTLVA